MPGASKYSYLLKQYPETVQKEQFRTRSLEDEWEEFEVERQNYRYAKLALGQLFTTNILTETQKRRFRLNIFYGLSSREIGRIEGASHQAVAKSLKIAVEKLRVIFAEQG